MIKKMIYEQPIPLIQEFLSPRFYHRPPLLVQKPSCENPHLLHPPLHTGIFRLSLLPSIPESNPGLGPVKVHSGAWFVWQQRRIGWLA